MKLSNWQVYISEGLILFVHSEQLFIFARKIQFYILQITVNRLIRPADSYLAKENDQYIIDW
ncbi:MAG: hypothetical protein ED554_13160 [Synechococcus sp. YX04-3]|nr:MAG: hypothetical protein ED554_13160 [Synechococcus sp. YX04-3]